MIKIGDKLINKEDNTVVKVVGMSENGIVVRGYFPVNGKMEGVTKEVDPSEYEKLYVTNDDLLEDCHEMLKEIKDMIENINWYLSIRR